MPKYATTYIWDREREIKTACILPKYAPIYTVCPGSSYSNLYSNSLYKLSQLLTGHTASLTPDIRQIEHPVYLYLFVNRSGSLRLCRVQCRLLHSGHKRVQTDVPHVPTQHYLVVVDYEMSDVLENYNYQKKEKKKIYNEFDKKNVERWMFFSSDPVLFLRNDGIRYHGLSNWVKISKFLMESQA